MQLKQIMAGQGAGVGGQRVALRIIVDQVKSNHTYRFPFPTKDFCLLILNT